MEDLEQRNKDWNAGFKKGIEHAEPSHKTLEYMDKTTDKLERLQKSDEQHNIQLSLMNKDIKNIIEGMMDIKNHLNAIDGRMDEQNKCYASKEELNKLDSTVEKLKQFRWQVLAILAVVMWAIDRFGDKLFN